MSNQMQRTGIGDHIHFNCVSDPKFKHNRLSVNFIMPLEEESASDNAVVPYILRKGCRSCPDFTSLNARLCELYGAVLDADITKFGGYQVLGVAIQALDNRFALEGEDIVGLCAQLLADVVLDPKVDDNGLFCEEDVALERQYVIDTIHAQINEKRAYAVAQCKKKMCAGEAIAVGRYGELETAEKITAASAMAAYRRMLKTAPVEIMFCGSGSPDAARAIFEKSFAGLPRESFEYSLPGVKEQAGEVREISETMEISQAKLVMGMRTGKIETPEQISAARLFSSLFGGTPHSKLFLNVREKLSLCYYCASRFDVSTRLLMVDSGIEAANKQKAQDEILRQLKAIQDNDFTDEDLENTKLLVKNSINTTTDSLSAIEGWYLTQILRRQNVSPQEDAAAIDAVSRQQVVQASRGVSLDTVYLLAGQ